MAPSNDAMEDPDPQDEAQKMALGQANSHDTFHRYLDLPFELRAPIRACAIQAARQDCRHNGRCEDSLPLSRLASVSREWQNDVEKALFSQIRVDPSNEEEVSEFEQHFTDRRKTYLTQLELVMDDDEKSGLWQRSTGLLNISQFMEKTGQLLQKLSAWNFSRDGNKQQPIAIIFKSTNWSAVYHPRSFGEPELRDVSLWDANGLSRVNGNVIPANVALWAVKSEFPSNLDMVTHLTFIPDCVPVAAAKRIIQAVPNLESCTFETHFLPESEDGWKEYTDFIHHLQASAPFLRKLRLGDRSFNLNEGAVAASMTVFANALRDFSQNLEDVHVGRLGLHEAFFLPFSDKADADLAASVSQCTWPKLQHLTLSSSWEEPTTDPGQSRLSLLDIVIAAARASWAMPNMKSMKIEGPRGTHFHLERENSEIRSCGFSEEEDSRIITAYVPPTCDEVDLFEEGPFDLHGPIRHFKWST